MQRPLRDSTTALPTNEPHATRRRKCACGEHKQPATASSAASSGEHQNGSDLDIDLEVPEQQESRTSSRPATILMTNSLKNATQIQLIPQVNNLPAEKENIPIVLKNLLADVFGGANGISKWIISPALCDPDTTAMNVLEKKSRTSNIDGADATPSARMQPGPAKNGRNLCTIQWQKNINKKGTTDQFRLYWGALSTAQQDKYQAKAKHLNSASSWKKHSDSAIINATLH
ncbi:hypothetical protein BDR03DRAFT_977112 [Suillus americanus]|nr:hypothetical protein BDR03DRAFT_977112 [Suillus americanus]